MSDHGECGFRRVNRSASFAKERRRPPMSKAYTAAWPFAIAGAEFIGVLKKDRVPLALPVLGQTYFHTGKASATHNAVSKHVV